jgi:hypothetical protein
MNDHELDLLWRGYTGGREAVAIKSGLGKLVGVCDAAVVYWPLDISVVKYIDHRGGAFIDYMDGFAPVISKDIIHVQDQELRIIHWSNYDDPPDHVSLPVDLASITERIVLVPGASEKFKDRVIQLLQDNRLDVPVERSRSDAQPMR